VIRQLLRVLIAIVVVGSVSASGASASPAPALQKISSGHQEVAGPCADPTLVSLLDLINGYRGQAGRQPLRFSTSLTAAAQHHAESMATFDYFDYALEPENITFDQNIRNFGYPGTYLGVDIAAGVASTDAATVFRQWQASPSQAANLLNSRFEAVGLGKSANPGSTYVNYWVAAFGDDPSDTITCPPPATATPTPTPTPTSSPTPTAPASPTASPTASATTTSVPTLAATMTPTATSTSLPTSTSLATLPPSDTATASPAASDTPTPEPSKTPTIPDTATPTPAATPTSTATPTPTETSTATATPAATDTASATATPTSTPTDTATVTSIPTATQTSTSIPTSIPTAIPAPSETPTATSTSTPRPSATPFPTVIPTPLPTSTATAPAPASPTALASPLASPIEAASPQASATPLPVALPASPVAEASPVVGSPVAEASPAVGSPVPAASPVAGASPVSGAHCSSSRASAKAGQDVVLTCTGFNPGEVVNVYFQQTTESARLGSFTAGSTGAGSLTFLAPEIPAGTFVVIARGASSFLLATTPLELHPAIFLTPKEGDPGDVISADLTGFQAGEAVTITWYDTTTSVRLLRRVTVGEDGSLTTTFRAPGSTAGIHTIEAVGLNSASATATFDLKSS
jgi:uncharacterized protein YkwD